MTTTTWTGTAGDGLWATAGNWDNGVPDATKDVVIAGSAAISTTGGTRSALSLDCSGYTGTISGTGWITTYGGAVTLNPLATFDVIFQIRSGTFHPQGAHVRAAALGAAALTSTVTIASDYSCAGFGNAGWTGTTIALGANVITYDSGTAHSEPGLGGTSWTWSAGGKLVIVGRGDGSSTYAQSIYLETYDSGTVLPPIEITGTGFLQLAQGGSLGGLIVPSTITGVGLLPFDWNNAGTWDVAFTGDVAIDTALVGLDEDGETQIGLDSHNLIVAGNFAASNTDLAGATGWTLSVTGAATLAGGTVSNCDASGGSQLVVTDGTDGGGNTNVSFVAGASAAPARRLRYGIGLGLHRPR